MSSHMLKDEVGTGRRPKRFPTMREATQKTVKLVLEEDLSAFQQHEKAVMTVLRNAYDRGPKTAPFDPETHWAHLIGVVALYCFDARKQRELPATDLRARLRELAKALGQARSLVDSAMQNDVGEDLLIAWTKAFGVPESGKAVGRFLPNMEAEFKKVIGALPALERAALDAANQVPTRRGRPIILPRSFIERLAQEYMDATGRKPGAGDGIFAKFVAEVLTALGRYNRNEDKGKRVICAIKYESVIDAIKDARAQARKRARLHPDRRSTAFG